MKKYLYRIYKIGGWACIVTALILTLLRVGMPFLPLQGQFSKWVGIKLQYPILIQDMKLSWQAFSPVMVLSNVQILTNDQHNALHIQKLKMRLNVLQLLMRKVTLEELSLEGMCGGLAYQQGVISVKELPGLQFNLNKVRSSSLPIAKRVWIKNSNIDVTINQDNVISLMNADIHVEMGDPFKIKVSLKDTAKEDALPEVWQLAFSNKIGQHRFVGNAVAQNVNLDKWQQRIRKGLLWLKPYNIQGHIKYLKVDFDENHGHLKLQSERKQVEYPDFFLQPLLFKDLMLQLEWHNNNGLDLHVKTFQATVLEVPLKGEGKIRLAKENAPVCDVFFELGNTTTENILKLFPQKKMDHELMTWLNRAVAHGEHLSTICVLRGNLSEFPFDKSQGIFEAYTELDKLNFNYYPVQNKPYWPALTNLKTSLHFHNRSLLISTEKGNLLSGELIDADAIIPDLFKAPELIVDAKMASTLTEALEVVEKSPLPHHLIKTLSALSLKGPMTLSLGLKMPLSKKSTEGIQVRGLIAVLDGIVGPKGWDYSITNLKGDISFTQNSISASNLSGLILGMPSQFTIEEQNGPIITAKGLVEVEKLQRGLNREIKNIQGTTDYSGTLSIVHSRDNNLQAALTLTSSLKGVAIDAPYPFAKEKDAITPIDLKFCVEPNKKMFFLGKYGDAHLATSVTLHTMQIAGAHLHFGNTKIPEFREVQGFLIDGDIEHLDFPTWKSFLSEILPSKNKNGAFTLAPLIELNIGAFSLFGLTFENQKIAARYENGINQWHAILEGPHLKGVVKIPESESSAVMVDLQKLVFNTTNEQPFAINKTPNTQTIDIKIKELIWGNKLISDIQARLEPSWKGYFFSNAIAKIKDNEITLSGNWDYLANQSKVSTKGKIAVKNVNDTLNALGLKSTVQKGKGIVDFDINWQGMPSKIDYATLSGQVEFFLNQGVIQGMNPGIGRVLSLLNLNNVKRRLNLDFSDVTKDGFAFDELNGKFQFGKGKVSSNKVILQGQAAKIEAFGQADLENKALDGEVVVMPNVTGSLPIAAAIAAGNPAIGAAVWAVDKMFGRKIQEIHRVHYKVLGTWDTPKVEEIALQVKGLPFESLSLMSGG